MAASWHRVNHACCDRWVNKVTCLVRTHEEASFRADLGIGCGNRSGLGMSGILEFARGTDVDDAVWVVIGH